VLDDDGGRRKVIREWKMARWQALRSLGFFRSEGPIPLTLFPSLPPTFFPIRPLPPSPPPPLPSSLSRHLIFCDACHRPAAGLFGGAPPCLSGNG